MIAEQKHSFTHPETHQKSLPHTTTEQISVQDMARNLALMHKKLRLVTCCDKNLHLYDPIV